MTRIRTEVSDAFTAAWYTGNNWYDNLRRRSPKLQLRRRRKSHKPERQFRRPIPTTLFDDAPRSRRRIHPGGSNASKNPSLWPELSSQSPVESKRAKRPKRSRFLELPFELREQIIHLAIGNQTLHLVDMSEGVGQIRCPNHLGVNSLFEQDSNCSRNCPSHLWRFVSYRSTPIYEYSSGVPPLLKTCRQLYTEGISLLYSRGVFEAEYPETVVKLQDSIRPENFTAIKSLRVTGHAIVFRNNTGIESFWDSMWLTICTSMALRNLNVDLVVQLESRNLHPPKWTDECQSFLKSWMSVPARQLRNLKHFSLSVKTRVGYDDRISSFQQKLQILICSSMPQGVFEEFPELFSDTVDGK